MICPNCKAVLSDDSVACNKCGMQFYRNPGTFQQNGNNGQFNQYQQTGNNGQYNQNQQNGNYYQYNPYQQNGYGMPQQNINIYIPQQEKKPSILLEIIIALCLIFTITSPIGIILLWAYEIQKNSFMRVLGTIVFTLIFLFWLGVIGGDGVIQDIQEQMSIEESQDSENTQKSKGDATVNEAVIYDDNDVIIKLKSLDGNKVKFYIENNSSKNYSINMHAYAINGYMADNNMFDMSSSAAKNSKVNVTFSIPKTLNSGYKVSDIKQMNFLIWFYDDDINYKAFDTGVLTVKTSLYDNKVDYDKGSQQLLSEKDISFQLVDKDEDEFVIGINNNSDSIYAFSGKNVVVNGYSLDTTYNLDIYDKMVFPGCFYPMTFEYEWSTTSKFKSENDISKIDSVTLNFEAVPDNDYSKSWDSSQLIIQY